MLCEWAPQIKLRPDEKPMAKFEKARITVLWLTAELIVHIIIIRRGDSFSGLRASSAHQL